MAIATRPLGIGELLDAGFRLYRTAFRRVIPLSILLALIGMLPSLLMLALDGMLVFVAVVLMLLVAFPIFMAAMIRMVQAVTEDEPLTIGQALGVGVGKLLPMVAGFILYGIAVVLGSILLLIPGLILMVSLMLFIYAIVLDGDGPVDALKTSHRLVWGNWWRSLVIISVPAILMLAVSTLLSLPFAFLAATAGPVALVGMELGNAVGQALLMPLFYTISVALYVDLKLRRSGDDLAERLKELPETA